MLKKQTLIKLIGSGMMICLVILVVVSAAQTVPVTIDWGSFDAHGATSAGIYAADDSTVLETYDHVDLIWTGPDNEIAPPSCLGEPTGDDLVIDTNFVRNGTPLPALQQNKGYVPFKTYTFLPQNDALNGAIYIRAWNAYSPLAATAYGDSLPSIGQPNQIFAPARWHTNQPFTSCGEPPPPPGSDPLQHYLPLIQTAATPFNMLNSANILFSAPEDFGGGGYEIEPVQHLTPGQRDAIQKEIKAAINQLQSEGSLTPTAATTAVPFAWPLSTGPDFADFGYHGISFFVDHNGAFPNQVRDYMCGDRTYDLGNGYNHQGTDYFLWPNAWEKMANNTVKVVAAAAGTIVSKQDGHDDMNCSITGAPWNAIYIQQADGSVAWYGHLKKGSLTTKQVGQTVSVGEYLGIVGSSGSSTEPHLHFELYNSNNQLIDPYAGSCNTLNNDSQWAQQRPYYDSAINKLMTGTAVYEKNSCPNVDSLHEQNSFMPGDLIYFTTFYRDQLASQTTLYQIYRPNGSLYQQWTHSSSEPHYAASYWWWSRRIEAHEPEGEWRFVVHYEDLIYQHEFLVGKAPTPAPVTNLSLQQVGKEWTVTWTAVSKDVQNQPLSVAAYHIYRSSDPYFTASPANHIGTVTESPFIDEALVASPDPVFYQIQAVNQFGGESASAQTIGALEIDLQPGWNLVSLPLLPVAHGLTDVLGPTLHGTADPTTADRVLLWDQDQQRFGSAWFCSSDCQALGASFYQRWLAQDYAPSNLTVQPDRSFWLHNRSGMVEPLMITGLVAQTDRQVLVNENWHLLGSSLPFAKMIAELNLPATGAETSETADRLLYWNATSQSYEIAWFCSGVSCETYGSGYSDRWLDENNAPSAIEIEVGHGFWYDNQHTPFTWTNETP